MKKLLLSALALSISVASFAETEDYFEGFEGWDSVKVDWLPDGWTEEYSSEEIFTLSDGAFTWHAGTQTGTIPYAPEGSAYALIYYAYTHDENGNKIDLPQDEWMISPALKVSKNSELSFYVGYSPFFLFDLNNENVDWGENDFINRKPSTTLKIHVRSNGGEWVLLKDLYDEWSDTSFSELFNNHFSSSFRKYSFDLSEYKDTEVEIAFQFVGMYGNTMEVDAISISNLTSSVERVTDLRNRPVVKVVGNDFQINPHSAKYVDVISGNAGKVMSFAIDGQTAVSHEHLPSGIYLFRFDDGTVVKVLK